MRKIKKIMIVHGKGIHTHGSDPVLGEMVRKFIEQDKSIIGVPIELYCEELKLAVIFSRPFHETIHGHRVEYAKNVLCKKNNFNFRRI